MGGWVTAYLVVIISKELNDFSPNGFSSPYIFIIDGLMQIVSEGSCNTGEAHSSQIYYSD
jgi:hypothetical protein